MDEVEVLQGLVKGRENKKPNSILQRHKKRSKTTKKE